LTETVKFERVYKALVAILFKEKKGVSLLSFFWGMKGINTYFLKSAVNPRNPQSFKVLKPSRFHALDFYNVLIINKTSKVCGF
jgi:hypothetical protein